MKVTTPQEAWDLLIELEIATQEELELVTCINGYTMGTMLQVLKARAAYTSFDQLQDEGQF